MPMDWKFHSVILWVRKIHPPFKVLSGHMVLVLLLTIAFFMNARMHCFFLIQSEICRSLIASSTDLTKQPFGSGHFLNRLYFATTSLHIAIISGCVRATHNLLTHFPIPSLQAMIIT